MMMRKRIMMSVFCLALIASANLSLAEEPSGLVSISEYELAYIFNGTVGGGKLEFKGNTYDFKLGGLGIGGIGASHISASGEVYNLESVEDFPGTYGEAGTGISVTDKGKGHLWLQNENGVRMHLITSQQGLGLTTGADGVVVKMR
jgi:hypothetical protein